MAENWTYWVITDPTGEDPDEPQVLVRENGDVQRWIPSRNAYVSTPTMATDIYGDDIGARKITPEQAEVLAKAGIGPISDENLAVLTRTPVSPR